MRYRPYGHSGIALSAIGLRVSFDRFNRHRAQMHRLLTAGLENGINAYHFDSSDPDFLAAAAESFAVIERRLLFVSLNAHDAHQAPESHIYALPLLKERLRGAIKQSGLEWIDLLLFGAPGAANLPPDSLAFLESLHRSRMVRHIGAQGETADLPDLMNEPHFSVLQTGFNIDSNWDKRRQIDDAVQRNLNMLGVDYFPDEYRKKSNVVPKAARRGWFGFKAPDPMAGVGTHAFLHLTPDWTPEQLCLSYALSHPSLACIYIDAESAEHVEQLVDVPERNLPPSVPAQIEMARFNPQGERVG